MLFDLFFTAGTGSELFFSRDVRDGSVVWLDGAGFYPSYFSDRMSGDPVRFVVLPSVFPSAPADFESIPFVEAELLETQEGKGKIRILSVDAFGRWFRQQTLLTQDAFASVPPSLQPDPVVMENLRDTLRRSDEALWVSPSPHWRKAGHLNGMMLMKSESDRRALLFTTACDPSYLVRL